MHRKMQKVYFYSGIDFLVSTHLQIGLQISYSAALGLFLGLLTPCIDLTIIPAVVLGVLSTFLSAYLFANYVDCESFFTQLPQTEINRLHYIEDSKPHPQKVYIKEKKELEIYKIDRKIEYHSQKEINPSMSTLDKIKGQKTERVTETKKYIPLKHRTKTLKDITLDRDDNSKAWRDGEKEIKRFE